MPFQMIYGSSSIGSRTPSVKPLRVGADSMVMRMTPVGLTRVQDNAIRALLLSNTDHEFSLPSLISFFLLFYGLAIVTTGVAVPSGLFVPCILCGASYGRAVGFLMTEFYPVRACVCVCGVRVGGACGCWVSVARPPLGFRTFT